ncbi:hypothetical protein Syun_017928 [Stephania yunnanensis]|uniref:Cytoplasmic tRNA 2-thiolation protein 2 n=1 Tax=Stephania yunnanensis TaxID=152371 RepID=A0AAP0NXW1_9MAGN
MGGKWGYMGLRGTWVCISEHGFQGCSIRDGQQLGMACATSACCLSGGGDCERRTIAAEGGGGPSQCSKCDANEAVTGSSCLQCFRSALYAKFRQAVTSHATILPTDNLLLAFSGGSASRVALQFVHEMQQKAQRNSDASRDRSYPVFGLGVAFVDESAAFPIPSTQIDQAIQDMSSILSNLASPVKNLHVIPIENICHSKSMDGRNRLRELLHNITDITGKEDFIRHLRLLCLQKTASENGYNKLILGSCASTISRLVIAATVKGQGYSLPADIQYVDARWEIPVMLPLRDCLGQELSMLCLLDSLKTLDVFNGGSSGVNGLVSSFITLLREENPARECTIVRTAEKLIPFHFNKLLETDDSDDFMTSRWHRKRMNLRPGESIASEILCVICSSPLNKSEVETLRHKVHCCTSMSERCELTCCRSCQFQILPKEPSSVEQFYSLLPQCIITQMKNHSYGDLDLLREQIEDCLLSDCDDDS